MNKQMNDVIKILLRQKQSISSNELAKQVGVSSRTIKRYIKNISPFFSNNKMKLISDGNGYKLAMAENNRIDLLNKISKGVYDDSAQLGEMILTYLLCTEYATIDELSERLFYSRNTITKKMKQVHLLTDRAGLRLCSKPHYGFFIDGNERSIRKCFAKYLKSYPFIQVRLRKLLGQKFEEKELLKILTNALKEFSLKKSTEEIDLFLKYLLVTILRPKKIDLNYTDDTISITHLRTVRRVLESIEKQFGLTFKEDEQYFLALVLGGGYTSAEEKEKIEQIIESTIQRVTTEFNEQFSSIAKLKDALVHHVSISLKRQKLGVFIENPLREMIQSRYFMSYQYALLLANALKKQIDMKIDENEISYMALHFEANLKRNNKNEIYNVLVVCGGGAGTSSVLRTKLERNFPQLRVQEVLPSYMLENIDLHSIDFIISTHTFENKINKKIVYISPILNVIDTEKIMQTMRKGLDDEYFVHLFSRTRFFSNVHFTNKKECLSFITTQLINMKIIDNTLKQQVFDREQTTTTEIGNLTAIPHCIVDSESKLLVCILDAPILWEEEQVQLIIFGCINTKDKRGKKIYPTIYNKVQDKERVSEILHCATFDQFVKNLI
ncbi:transcription antiterminator [Sporolactobacillus sp. THM7-4]|nr:transcription antiterminator [Sporolactobacillus sp. THM7-4]